MKAMWLVVALAIGGCAQVNGSALAASTIMIACDWGQTRSAAVQRMGMEDGEAGPAAMIIGRRPNAATVDAYFASAIVLNAVLWHLLPARWRSLVPAGVVAAQADMVAFNVRSTGTVCGVPK